MNTTSPMISFLITHYNRSHDLLLCLNAIRSLDLSNYEIVVCDDASQLKHLEIIQQYPIDQLLLAKKNGGLAANINRGLRACRGQYIIYCQEDFMLSSKLTTILPECMNLLKSQKVDMIRLMAYFEFKKVIQITSEINLIPKFSIQNFLYNTFQYSDHPFITTKSFFDQFGYYLEDTSGDYGETEFAIRIFKSKAKIAIISNKYILPIVGSTSVIDRQNGMPFGLKIFNKKFYRFFRALRLYFESFLYNNARRGLMTYTNHRNPKI